MTPLMKIFFKIPHNKNSQKIKILTRLIVINKISSDRDKLRNFCTKDNKHEIYKRKILEI